MATILAHITIRDGQVQAFEQTIRGLYEATHRLEPGCRRYEYWRGAAANFYYCLLSFDDFRAFLTHQTSPHHEAPDFAAMLEKIELEWIDPVAGASDLPTTEAQALPADADETMRRYAELYGVKVADWWRPLRGTDQPEGR